VFKIPNRSNSKLVSLYHINVSIHLLLSSPPAAVHSHTLSTFHARRSLETAMRISQRFQLQHVCWRVKRPRNALEHSTSISGIMPAPTVPPPLFPPVTRAQVNAARTSAWHPKFRASALKTTVIDLTGTGFEEVRSSHDAMLILSGSSQIQFFCRQIAKGG
jgi:hypothetical protein